jgi:tartrate/fumarate subfamily iron-sulfur-dependent hydro-lyase beta chain
MEKLCTTTEGDGSTGDKHMNIVRLQTPLTEENVRTLKLGDLVYITGHIFTARTSFHTLVVEKNKIPSLDFTRCNVMAHCGPVMKKNPAGEWIPVHAGGTTSNRFERYGSAIIQKLRLRAIIGKGTMGEETLEVMREFGAVHLTTNLDRMGFTPYIVKVVDVFNLEELGQTEATWVFVVKECGPFVVDMDTFGNNLFLKVQDEVKKRYNSF